MNQETITGSVNHEGLFTAKNPYEAQTASLLGYLIFADATPALPCYTPSNELVIDVENVAVVKGMHVQFNIGHQVMPLDKFAAFKSGYNDPDYGYISTLCYITVPPTEKPVTETPKESEEKEMYYCLSDNADLNGLYLSSMREVSEHIEMDLGDIEPSDRENVQYTITPVYLTQTEFDNLPEYEG